MLDEHFDDADLWPSKRSTGVLAKIFMVPLLLIIFPLYLVFVVLAMVLLLLFTVTGIGPLLHFYFSRGERHLVDREKLIAAHPEIFLLDAPADLNSASAGAPYKIAVRLTFPSTNAGYPPVIFPQGLAATMMATMKIQEYLEAAGFASVNFDRFGVGLSDANNTGLPPSAHDVAKEMDFVMRHCDELLSQRGGYGAAGRKWIAVGGSMGAIVATAFMTVYPNRLSGLLNLDGFPHGFVTVDKLYLNTYAPMWGLYGKLAHTGMMRLLFSFAKGMVKSHFESTTFDWRSIIAQMNQSQFFKNARVEFNTMISCADLTCAAMENLSTVKMDKSTMRLVCGVAPFESVLINEPKGKKVRIVTTERSNSELGADWLRKEVTGPALERLLSSSLAAASGPLSIDRSFTSCSMGSHPVGSTVGGVPASTPLWPLNPQLRAMSVRVMSMRSYDGGDGAMGEQMYSQNCRNHSAAEHTLQAALARSGKRIVYPKLTHGGGFAQTTEIRKFTIEIAEDILCFSTQV
jgi:pimeloyl-ACP methyl ester carboxylesterase